MPIQDKPRHLGPQYGAQFQDEAVISAYGYRPPMPDEILSVLMDLLPDAGAASVLDVGCGQGEIARPLAERVQRVDAVDWSRGMVEAGRRLPGGDRENLRWIHGKAEEAPLAPPYTLVTAGQSLHWMDWDVMLPRLACVLEPGGLLAIVGWDAVPPPWQAPLLGLIRRLSTNQDYRPYNLIDELVARDLFVPAGQRETRPVPFRQPLADYIASLHARNGLSRDRMSPEAADAFDREVRTMAEPFQEDGALTLMTGGLVVWGRPLRKGG